MSKKYTFNYDTANYTEVLFEDSIMNYKVKDGLDTLKEIDEDFKNCLSNTKISFFFPENGRLGIKLIKSSPPLEINLIIPVKNWPSGCKVGPRDMEILLCNILKRIVPALGNVSDIYKFCNTYDFSDIFSEFCKEL